MSMPFGYVSPEQLMKDKADYARRRIAQNSRSAVVLSCEVGILFATPNSSRALRKVSELYDRIAFAAVGRYNEFETLRKAGVRYADMTGFQYDRRDVTARGLADWYGQLLGSLFTDSPKPYEVEIVVAQVGKTVADDEIYRITYEGSVADEHDFVVVGGQADRVAAVIKEHYSATISLAAAMRLAIDSLVGQGDAATEPLTSGELEVALLERDRPHRAFRRITGARLEALLAEAGTNGASATGGAGSDTAGPNTPAADAPAADAPAADTPASDTPAADTAGRDTAGPEKAGPDGTDGSKGTT